MAVFDVTILGAHVLDGTGKPAVRRDIGIVGEKIAALDDLSAAESRLRLELDSAALLVAPGFIDVHTHSDAYLLIEPCSPSKVFQGVTTEVVGNCGGSAAPLFGAARLPSDWADKTYPGAWKTVAEYRGLLEQVRPAVNVVTLAGHGTLRAGVAGYDDRPLTPDEQCLLQQRLEQALDEGARGLSTGLIYAPGMFAPRAELVELARIVERHDGIYTSHMRSESDRLEDALNETLQVGRETGVRVQVSHLKAAGSRNWPGMEAVLERIRSARAGGVDAAADRYPYTSSATDLDVIFPAWAAAGGREAVLERLDDCGQRGRLRRELLSSHGEDYWATITIGSTVHPDNRRLRGMSLPDAACELGLDCVDAVLHLAETDRLATGAFFQGMCTANMHRVLREPWVMIGSDASLRAPSGPLSHDYPHPRAYGAFARFLRMALDGETVELPEAVRKMTSLAAERFRLPDRGTIAVGNKADLVVFDPDAVRDTATYADPHRLAEGIQHVFVNGVAVLSGGQLTGSRPGAVL